MGIATLRHYGLHGLDVYRDSRSGYIFPWSGRAMMYMSFLDLLATCFAFTVLGMLIGWDLGIMQNPKPPIDSDKS